MKKCILTTSETWEKEQNTLNHNTWENDTNHKANNSSNNEMWKTAESA